MTTMTMQQTEEVTYKQLADLFQGLSTVKDLKGVKFALQITKNFNMIQAELKHLEEAAKPSEEFVSLAQKVQAIESSNEIEDKQGEIEKLEKDNADIVQVRKDQIAEFQKMLEETTEVSFFKIKESNLPEEINAEQLSSIILIIKE